MLDHALLDAIAALRRGLEGALLERHSFEERLQVDVLLGDVAWETSYTLPGEGVPPRVQADITFDWPTWSQAAYRSWCLGEGIDEPPEIDVEILLRVQRMTAPPQLGVVLAVLPEPGPEVGGEPLERSSPTIEQLFSVDLDEVQYAMEVSYAITLRLEEPTLEDKAALDVQLAPLGSWIASTLVRLADLDLAFLPPEQEEEDRR